MRITSIAAACIALNGLLLFGLSAAITLRRRKTRTYFGWTMDPRDGLYRLVRAHGNTAEYAGVSCMLIWVAAQSSPSLWTVSASLLVTAGRFSQVAGMLSGPTLDSPPNALRLFGTTGTYVGGAALCLLLVLSEL
jgi:uncharacterized membrane protein YecN with MAPEG domain